MAHLKYSLYDKVGDNNAIVELSDDSPIRGSYFHNLNNYDIADKAAEIRIKLGNEYHRGDHIQLFDNDRDSYTDTVCIDPDINPKVDLNRINLNNKGFADRVAAVSIKTNPNQDGSFRLRVRLYDKVPSTTEQMSYPILILYDWEVSLNNPIKDLNQFHFADKAAYIFIEKGSSYHQGDKVVLLDSISNNSRVISLEPGNYDLNSYDLQFADKAAAIKFDLIPDAHLIVHLFDRVGDSKPLHIISDFDPNDPKRFIKTYNLNNLNAADKVAQVFVEPGPLYQKGDHLQLLDQVGQAKTDTVCIDPDVNDKVDLNKVFFNNKGFADRTAAINFIANTNAYGGFRLRAKLFDLVPNDSQRNCPAIILYDWQYPENNSIADLNNFHFADKTAYIIVEKGPNYIEGDKIILYDKTEINANIKTYPINPPFREEGYNLNMENFGDKAAAIKFQLEPKKIGRKKPEKVELYEGSVLKLTLVSSDPGSLNNRGNYKGRASFANIYGLNGSGVTFFDNNNYQLNENAVHIRKLVDEPITVNIASNFVTLDEEAGDAVYMGKDPNNKYEWQFFKTVKNSLGNNLGEFLNRALKVAEESKWENAPRVVDGIKLIQAIGVGKKSSNNYRVDNCSSVFFDSE
jgi:hypothetical protein